MRRVALVLVLASTVVSAFAQGPKKYTQAVYLDHLTGALYRERFDGVLEPMGTAASVRNYAPVQLHVINVNTFKYKVTVKSHEEALFRTLPSVLKTNDFVQEAELHQVDANPLSITMSRDIGSGKDVTRELANVRKQIEEVDQQATQLAQVLTLDNKLISLARHAPEPILMPGIKDPREPGLKAVEQVRQQVKAVVGEVLGSGEPLSRDISNGMVPNSVDLHALATRKLSKLKRDFSALQDDYDDLRSNLRTTAKALSAPSRDTDSGDNDAEVKKITRVNKRLDDAFTELESKIRDLDRDSALRDERLERASAIYDQIMTQNFYDARGYVTTPKADLLVYNVDVTQVVDTPTAGGGSTAAASRDIESGGSGSGGGAALPAGEVQVKSQEVPVYVTGKTKIDFSTGLLFSSLTDESVNIEKNAADHSFIRAGSKDQFTPSIGALMHVYKTSSANITPALSLGLAMPTTGTTGSLQYFLGGSLLVGRDQRFVVTGGVTGRYVNRLDGVKVGQDVTNLTSSNGFVKSVFRIGYFLGLTFNIR